MPGDDGDVAARHAGHDEARKHAPAGEEKLKLQEKQGYSPFGVRMKVTDDENVERPWDGKTLAASR